ncbi:MULTISPECIES: SDR family NAD(P)-dependent oxidoreductase [unclassified Pseudofrankia]|uniref:SDR family NAD(P)-dependent oxidoreductase n=1 Tax=unclassified Pseudofrankia TaxID=2994372 RepID=UPI0008DA1B48|nr:MULTISPECIES: SDR family oxidoreductase [unclassified Pseudofrankia]MDT3444080.1 SDR family oxidoreductase [Pseudofrankia sp. BMG5.37]OHV65300.1 short-chain dehydrogenase [Pseudofrankia sp. BMG5.36]
MTGRFDGKAALITGAGSGMGRSITIRLASEGASVLAVDIDEGSLAETKALASGTVSVRVVDVADPTGCAEAVAAAVSEFGRLDVLGNVAGIYRPAHTTDTTVEQYRRTMAVNLDGPFFLSQAAIPHLLAAGGTIINIASNAGIQGVPYSAAYAASKGGIVQLTKSLAVEFIKTPLRVNAIAPAGTLTNIARTVTFPEDQDSDLRHRMAGYRGIAMPEEIAALFAFLASGEAKSITGAVYAVDNGLTVS